MSDPPSPDFRYWAFISYSSKDAALAKKLHRELEAYRIPRDLRGRPGRDGDIPARLYPVFRDRDELPLSSDLGGSIQSALHASRYLIVLCSPNSAKSRWVNEEIKYFKKIGRADRILALILDGEPGATEMGQAEREAFPPALRYVVDTDGELTQIPCEPIGGDLRKGGDGWHRSFLKAVAGITGMGFDAFARREAKRRRRKQLVLAAFSCLLLGCGIAAWDYFRTKVSYYHELTFKNGEPYGLVELPKSHVKKRFQTFKLESSRRKVRQVQVVSSQGHPTALQEGSHEYPAFSSLQVSYRENGKVSSHRYRHVNGKEFVEFAFSEDLKNLEQRRPGSSQSLALSNREGGIGGSGWAAQFDHQNQSTSATEVSGFDLVYDDQGFLIEKRYLNAWGAPTRNGDGAFAIQLKRGSRGEVIEESTLDQQGLALPSTITRAATRKLIRNPQGFLIEEQFLDAQGQLVNLSGGFACIRVKRDEVGNDRERRFFLADGSPGMRFGCHHFIVADSDEVGNVSQQTYWDDQGKPGLAGVGLAHREVYDRDAQQRFVGIRYFNEKQEAMILANSGIHRYEIHYDQKNNPIEYRFFDADQQPCLELREKAYKNVLRYNENNELLETSYFGSQEEPVVNSRGFHREVRRINRQGLTSELLYFGAEQQACRGPNGVHLERIAYDAKGNTVSVSYFDADGKAVESKDGYHRMEFDWDERGNRIREAYFNQQGLPSYRRDWSVSSVKNDYDDQGRLISVRSFGVNGETVEDQFGYHQTRNHYDEEGNLIRVAYFGPSDEPRMSVNHECHRIDRTYTKNGKLSSEKYFDLSGKALHIRDGYHELRQIFDPLGRKVEESYYDRHGIRVNRLSFGVAAIRFEYGKADLEIKRSYYDTQNKPCVSKVLGYHQIESTYNQVGQLVERRFLNTSKALVQPLDENPPLEKRYYNARGLITRWENYGTDEKPMMREKEGYFAKELELDSQGQITAERYFDKQLQPCLYRGLYHVLKRILDVQGQTLEKRYFNTQNAPCLGSNRAHLEKYEYNHFGKPKRIRYFGVDDKPTCERGDVHDFHIDYNHFGHRTKLICFNPQGEPTVDPNNGVHRSEFVTNLKGDIIEQRYFGIDEHPVLSKEGWHLKKNEFHTPSYPSKTTYYGVSGEPVIEKDYLAHQIETTYNAQLKILRKEHRGATLELTNCKDGFCIAEYGYDQEGRLNYIKTTKADGTIFTHQKATYYPRSRDIKQVIDLLKTPNAAGH